MLYLFFTERFLSLDSKAKSNPLTLEEVRKLMQNRFYGIKKYYFTDDTDDHIFVTCKLPKTNTLNHFMKVIEI